MTGTRFELAAEFADEDVDHLVEGLPVRQAVDGVVDRFARHHTAMVLRQHQKNHRLAVTQAHGNALQLRLPSVEVDDDVADDDAAVGMSVRAPDRQSVVTGKSGAVSVNIGGCRDIKKQKHKNQSRYQYEAKQ